MQVQLIRVWQSYPILNQLYQTSTSGKLRYNVKENTKRQASHYETALEWVRADKLDFGWEGDAIPFEDKDFLGRFTTYLIEERVELEPYYFAESLMQFADGITGEQENAIAWLFEENKPTKQPNPPDAPPSEEPS